MKRELARTIHDFFIRAGIPLWVGMIGCVLLVCFLIYLDKDKYLNWKAVPAQEKFFLVIKVLAVPLLIAATIRVVFGP